jgi:protein-S-isoprenylcysteine O-methyltransferase Ste14
LAGIVLLATGIILYGMTIRLLLKGLKNTKLVTAGPYRYCRNPLYATIILLIVPGVSLLLNSWLLLIVCVVANIRFRMVIRSEYAEMEKFFGDEWTQYCKRTPEFFPFPLRKG